MNDPGRAHDDRHANRNLVLLVAVALLVVAAVLGPWFVHHWVERAGAADIVAVAALPERIHVCDRDWHRGPAIVRTTIDEARARSGIEPVVVDIAPFAPCPAGPCTRVAEATPCDTVVYVRVGATEYVAFDLVGGP